MEGSAEEGCVGTGASCTGSDAQPTLGQDKASQSYSVLFSGSDQTTG